MSFVRTVLGDVPAAQLGACYAHEHIIIDPSYTTQQHPDYLLDSVEAGVAELRQFHADVTTPAATYAFERKAEP